jgi:hypothetical protein
MGEQNVGVVARWAEAIQRGDLAEELWDADLLTVRAGRIVHAVGYLTKGRALTAIERGTGAA